MTDPLLLIRGALSLCLSKTNKLLFSITGVLVFHQRILMRMQVNPKSAEDNFVLFPLSLRRTQLLQHSFGLESFSNRPLTDSSFIPMKNFYSTHQIWRLLVNIS